MTYESIDGILRSNHFYPIKETESGKTVSLQVECPSIILMEDRCTRLRDILDEAGVKATVTPMKNLGYISIVQSK